MIDFQEVADQLIEGDPDLAQCRPVIEKELLHVEILRAMHDAGHLSVLMFKGGTCLRLCYGALRLSEDLDFSGGTAFDHRLLDDIEDVLRKRIGERYGLEVTVSPPKLADGRDRTTNRWVARVVTRPAPRGSVGVQRIKIEIDNHRIPPDAQRLPIRQRHGHLEGSFGTFPIAAASLDDIASDKMIALPMSILERAHPRYRDVWDLEWIDRRQGAAPMALGAAAAASKASAAGLAGRYLQALDVTAERIRSIVDSNDCRQALARFLPRGLAESTIGDAGYREYLASKVREMTGSVRPLFQELEGR